MTRDAFRAMTQAENRPAAKIGLTSGEILVAGELAQTGARDQPTEIRWLIHRA